MKNVLLAITLSLFSSAILAAQDYETKCGNVNVVNAWQGGSDQYGLRIALDDPMPGCEGGFYIPHSGENKQYVYSTALTAFSANINTCIQIELVSNSIDDLCKVNLIMLTK